MQRREAFVRDRDSTLNNSNQMIKLCNQLEVGVPVDNGTEWPEDMQKLFGFSATGNDLSLEASEPVKVPYVPKTDCHIKAMNAILEATKDKRVPLDEFGIPKVSCWCQKPLFCQICDNRKVFKKAVGGNWVSRQPILQDPMFSQYQTNIIRDKTVPLPTRHIYQAIKRRTIQNKRREVVEGNHSIKTINVLSSSGNL